MTRGEVEKLIRYHCERISEVVKEYDQNIEYVAITLNPKTKTIIAYNRHWANDIGKPIDLMTIDGKTMRGIIQQEPQRKGD